MGAAIARTSRRAIGSGVSRSSGAIDFKLCATARLGTISAITIVGK
jgi:hypothetical protein